jgi:cytoskeletal protein CcmA (bactofilin family)
MARTMRRPLIFKAAAAMGIAGALGWLPMQVAAADLRQGNDVTIGSGQTINDDLYAAGATITVDGTVNGSVIAAGGTITISGTISRDLIVAGGTINVTGRVGGSIRAAGGNLTLNGPVEQDIVLAGGMVDIGSKGSIGRDLVMASGTATVSAPIGRNVTMGSGTLTLRNHVGGNVRGRVDHLKLDGAQVAGNLDYTSANQVEQVNGARVAGTITRHQPPANMASNGFVDWLRALIGIAALGLIFLFLLPRLSGRSIDTLRAQPWLSLGIGAAILIATPIAALIVFLIGLLIGGWWIGLLLIPIWILACAVGYVVSAFLSGRLIFARLGWGAYPDLVALLAGLLVLAIVTVIPLIGWLIGLAAVVFGLGALGLATTQLIRPARTAAV